MQLFLHKIVFNFTVFGEGYPHCNGSVTFDPILSSGYHAKVAVNNKIIGDQVVHTDADLPTAVILCKKYLHEPIQYKNDTGL